MSIRIRVYPQNGLGGLGGYGGYGGYGSTQALRQQLQNQKQVSNLQLSYERQLMQQQVQLVRLQTQAQYGGVGYGAVSPYGAYGGMASPYGAIRPYGAVPVAYRGAGMLGAVPPGFGGQQNITNQNCAGAGNQSVTNSNVSYSMQTGNPFGGFGFPFGGGQGGGFLSNVLGGMF